MRGEASIEIQATPEEVYAVVSDVTRTPEWSPECQRIEWVKGSSDPVVGATFKGTNKHGRSKWSTTNTIVVARPGSEFAFDNGQTRWTYRMEPMGGMGGTRLTESFDVHKPTNKILDFVATRLIAGIKDRQADLEANVRHSLERIKAIVESSR